MAGNVKTGNPWILDTAEEVVAKGTIIRIKAIKFARASAGDQCILHDGDGKVIYNDMVAQSNGYNRADYFGERGFATDGLTVNDVGNGLIYLYLADTK